MTLEVTDNERRVIELLRGIKANSGHGTLRVTITAGWETFFEPMRAELPKKKNT